MTDILTHREAVISTITFNRLDKKNSITSAMYAALADAVEAGRCADRPPVCWCSRAMKPFSVRATTFAEFPATRPLRWMRRCSGFCGPSVRFPKPVVAAVCSPAGIGTHHAAALRPDLCG